MHLLIVFFSFFVVAKCSVKMSSHNHETSDDEMESHSHRGTQNQLNYEFEHDDDTNEGGEHEPDRQGKTSSIDSAPPDPPCTDCPSALLTKWPRGTYDLKSPLIQFATKDNNPNAIRWSHKEMKMQHLW